MIKYSVLVSRGVVETTTLQVEAATEQDAVDQAIIAAQNQRDYDWERETLTYTPVPYASVYDVTEDQDQ